MLAYEVGRAVAHTPPGENKGVINTVINKGGHKWRPVCIPLGVFYFQTLQGLAVWNHQGIWVSGKTNKSE